MIVFWERESASKEGIFSVFNYEDEGSSRELVPIPNPRSMMASACDGSSNSSRELKVMAADAAAPH